MTLEDIVEKVISDNLNLYCPHCERTVDQDEELHKKIAQEVKRWILDKYGRWCDNRIVDTRMYMAFAKEHDIYLERISTLQNARQNLKNILEEE